MTTDVVTTDALARLQFGAAFERARFPMALLGEDLEVLRANPCLADLLGLGVPELVGRSLEDLVLDEDVPALRAAAEAADRGAADPREVRFPVEAPEAGSSGRDDLEARVELVVEAVGDMPDQGVRYLAQMRDVTDEHLAAERLRRLVRLHSTLSGADEAVLRAGTAQELFESACQVAVDHAGFRLAWIGRYDAGDASIDLLAARGPGRGYITGLHLSAGLGPDGQGPAGTAVRERRTEVRDIAADPRMAPWRASALASGFASCAALPLLLDGRAAGVLTVYAEERHYFEDEVIALLERLAENVSYGWQALEHDAARRRSQAELEEQTRRLRQRFDQTSVPSLTLDLSGTVQDVNAALCALVGRPREALVGAPAHRLLADAEPAGDLPAWAAGDVVERRLCRPDGETRWALVSGTLVRDAGGECFEVYVQMQDVTHRHVAEELAARRQAQQAALAELGREALAEGSLEALFDRATSLVATCMRVDLVELLEVDDREGCLLRRAIQGASALPLPDRGAAVELEGTMAGLVLRSEGAMVVADHRASGGTGASRRLLARGMRSSASVAIRSDGDPIGVLSAHASVPHSFGEDDIPFLENVAYVIGAAVSRRQAADELRRRAQYDRLTGLPNRAFLLQRLEELLARGSDACQVALLFIDLDRFKLVNDSLGHGAGDELLRSCGERVATSVRPGDLVARFGGDELVVLADAPGGPEGAADLSERILAALACPVRVAGQEISTGASIGIALGRCGDVPSDLLRNADIAMYRAKALGGSCAVVFDAAMRASLEDRLELEAELRRALERDELVVHYQPVVDVARGLLVGAEALVRWRHPERGLMEPASFVPLAEETGLVVGLGARVLDLACADLARWHDALPSAGFVMSVNVSARQLRCPAYPASVAATLARHGVTAGAICLEITESVLLEDSGTTLRVLEELKALGVRLSVDDFGTGYSSLAYLKRYPIDELKVDRSFVAEIEGSDSQAAIVGGVVQLARALEVAVVAEGVETSHQLDRVRDLGCDRAQGFLISTPVAGTSFAERWLQPARA